MFKKMLLELNKYIDQSAVFLSIESVNYLK